MVENSSGELFLGRAEHPGSALLLWKDVRVVVSNDRSAPFGTPVEGVAQTPAAIVEWLTTYPDYTVIEEPKPATILGISGTVLAIGVSQTADFGHPECPPNPRCADILGDPAHWTPPGAYGIGGDESVRLFLATVHLDVFDPVSRAAYPDGNHLFVVAWQGISVPDLRAFADLTPPILDSIRLPDRYVIN